MRLTFTPNYLEDELHFHFVVANRELDLIPVTTKINDLLFKCVGEESDISVKLLAMAYLAQVIESEAKRRVR